MTHDTTNDRPVGGGVLVNLGRFGDGLLHRLQAALPDEDVVAWDPAGPPGSPSAPDVLVTLLDDPPGIAAAMAPSVRWVHVLGAGIDGFPLDALGDRTLTCSRGAGAAAIAEWVLAMMLAFEKDLPASWIHEPPAQWNIARLGGLRGRTLGLVGIGAIGSAVARRAQAFDMRVIATRRTAAPADDGIERAASLAELLAAADHIVVAAPATAETRHLIDADALGAVKPGAHLINIARGSLVDQDALLAALDDGRLAMASLDVVEPEPLPAGHPLFTHPRVRLSPHISWSSPETSRRTMELFVENVARYRAGEPLTGAVDLELGY